VIETSGLTKTYGATVAVDGLSLKVEPGRVTGFLGPNGSGKSTSMRCIVQLDRPTAGTATINGRPFHDLDKPLREVGVLLDATYLHPGRRACDHLWAMAASNGLPKSRVDEVLAMVGLSDVASKRVKSYSLGMRQRLGLAGVMLGDPHTVMLDEPGNGLDPEGIRWIREFLSYLAQQGRTVFVSSHQLSEMALMADHLVVIGKGRLIEEGSVPDFIRKYSDHWVRGLAAAAVGEIAAAQHLVLHELAPQTGSLEDAFLRLTAESQEYRTAAAAAPAPPPAAGPPPLHAPPLHAPSPAAGSWAPPQPGSEVGR
jgi:ABC-2 type transport system ATP-binding protein